MREKRRVLELDPYEQGAVISALNDMRNERLRENRPAGAVEDVLLKAIDAPCKKVRVWDETR